MRTDTKAPTRTPKHLAPKLHAEAVGMPSHKPSASSYLTNTVESSVRASKKRYHIDGVSVNEALYATFQAARPAILLYLNGKGPRPHDPSMWFTEQDRKVLRRLHTRGMARNDPRYFDALMEAAQAGASLSRRESKDLVEHVRVMDDGLYPAIERRVSALSTDVQALIPNAKLGGRVRGGGRARGLAIAQNQAARCIQWNGILRDYYKEHPPTRRIPYRAEASRRLEDARVKWNNDAPGYDLLRKEILPPLLRELFPHLYS